MIIYNRYLSVLLLAASCLGWSASSLANGTIHGQIYDRESNQAVPYAVIKINKGCGKVNAREDGTFHIDCKADEYNVKVKAKDYKTETLKEILLAQDEKKQLNIGLTRKKESARMKAFSQKFSALLGIAAHDEVALRQEERRQRKLNQNQPQGGQAGPDSEDGYYYDDGYEYTNDNSAGDQEANSDYGYTDENRGENYPPQGETGTGTVAGSTTRTGPSGISYTPTIIPRVTKPGGSTSASVGQNVSQRTSNIAKVGSSSVSRTSTKATPRVTKPTGIKLIAGAKPFRMFLTGTGLDQITKVVALNSSNRVDSNVVVRLDKYNNGGRYFLISATRNARVGKNYYRLRLHSRSGSLVLASNIVGIDVRSQQAPVYQQLPTGTYTKPGTITSTPVYRK